MTEPSWEVNKVVGEVHITETPRISYKTRDGIYFELSQHTANVVPPYWGIPDAERYRYYILSEWLVSMGRASNHIQFAFFSTAEEAVRTAVEWFDKLEEAREASDMWDDTSSGRFFGNLNRPDDYDEEGRPKDA
jgi:hypothetical protein